MALNAPPGQPTPRWSPPGDQVPDNVWAYDIQRNGWIPPDEPVNADRTQLVMPPGWQPRGRDMPWQVVMSPPGTPAPMGTYNYTPKSREVHQPGAQAPVSETNLSLVPAGRSPIPAGGATAPVPAPPPPGAPPPGGPGMPAPQPPAPPGAPTPQRPPAPGMHPGGGAPPPTGMMPPGPSPTPLGTPPILRPPQQQQAPVGQGQGHPADPAQPQSLDPEMIARALLAQLVGVDATSPRAVGQGQAVGVGAASPPSGVLDRNAGVSQNDLQLSPAEAQAACGPAAVLFMNAMGRPPTADEAQRLRQQAMAAGWTPGAGMGGTANFQRLARAMGVETTPLPVDHDRIAQAVQAGQPVVVSTPAHYWQLGDYNPDSGKFQTVDAVGRNREMSLAEIQADRYGGRINGVFASPAPGGDQPGAPARGDARLLSAQGAPQTTNPVAQQGQQRGLVQLAADHGASPELAQIMATGALMESGGNPNNEGDNKHSQGLYMMHDGGTGAGMTVAARRDPDNATQVMLQREYQPAYDRFRQQGLSGVELARAVYLAAERPDMRDPRVQAHVQNDLPAYYQNVTQAVVQGKDMALGSGQVIAAPGGSPQQQAQQAQQAPQNITDQIWAAAQQVAQQVSGAVAPRTAYAAETASAPGPAPAPVATPGPMGAPQMDATPQPAQAPAAAAATPSPQAAASPAVAPAAAALATLPQNQERAAAYGYQPAAGPAYSAPPNTNATATDPRANVPAREAPPGFHWDTDVQQVIPDAAGVYPLPGGGGSGYFNPTTKQWQPISPNDRTTDLRGVQVGEGLRVVQDPTTGSSMLYADGGDGSIRAIPITPGAPPPAADDPGWTTVRGPQQTPITPYQSASLTDTRQAREATLAQDSARLAEQIRTTDLSDSRARAELEQRMQEHADALKQTEADRAQQQAQYEGTSGNARLQAGTPRQVGGRLVSYQPSPDDPSQMTAVDMGEVTPTPGEQESARQFDVSRSTLSAADTARLRQPQAIGGGIFQYNPDSNDLSQIGDVPMTPEAQANIDERKFEFGNLSAEQQATIGQRQYEFGNLSAEQSANLGVEQQRLSQQHQEAMLPYEQMTKQQQAQNQIDQQKLGLQQQQFGLQEQQAQNQLEPLPRGGIARVNPFTGAMQMVNAPEPEAEQYMGGYFYTPAGRTVNIGGQTVSGGPNPYAAWTPSQAGYGSWAPPQMQQQSAMQASGMQNWRPPQPQPMQGWGAPQQQQGWGGGMGGFGGY